MVNKIFSRTSLCILASLFTLLFGLSANGLELNELDSDDDGLSDQLEMELGLDPDSVDSDMDGLSDADEYGDFSSFQLRSVDGDVADAKDSDGDGLNDFLETYGYYIVDNQATMVPRRIHIDDWNELKSDTLEDQGVKVFEVALDRLERDLSAVPDSEDENYLLLNLDGAKNAIISAYIDAGISSTSKLVVGLSNRHGSAANILKTLLQQDLKTPTDDNGQAFSVYFTHPLKVSTDHDPYTDLDEALGVFPSGRPVAPADHPLIAAAPYLKAELEEFEVIIIEQNHTNVGERDTEIRGTTSTRSQSHSHGFSIALKREWEGSFLGPKFKSSIEVKQDNSWRSTRGTSLFERNSHSTYRQTGTKTQSNCFAKLNARIAIENSGYANASNVSLALNIYLGNAKTPWETITLGANELGNLLLSPGEKQSIAALRTEEEGCLTIDETNYLAQGGEISVETIVADAKVDFFNPSSNLVEQGGSWQVYNNLIQQDLALMNIDVNATNGKQIDHSLYYFAADPDYPNLSLSVEQALATAFTKTSCDSALNPNARCFLTSDNDQIVLGPNTWLDVVFYDDQGVSLSNLASRDSYHRLSPIDNDDPFAKFLTRRSSVSIVNNEFEIPQFTHIEAINLVHADGNEQPDLNIRASVSDFFGIQEVLFCHTQADCQPMSLVFNNAASQDVAEHSGMYSITLANHVFSGSEFVKAVNILGNESAGQRPETFFSLMHESLNSRVTRYSTHIENLQQRIDALSRLQSEEPQRYAEIVSQGFVSPTDEAQTALNELKTLLNDAAVNCTLNAGTQSSDPISELENLRRQCLSDVEELEQVMQNRSIKAFALHKLPGQHLYERYLQRTRAGKDRGLGDFDANRSRKCELERNQFAVGIGATKKNDRSTPVYIHLKYVEYDPLTRGISNVRTKACGEPEKDFEKFTELEVDPQEGKAELILDMGMSLHDNIRPINRKKSRWVSRLCLSYRLFDFNSGQWQGEVQYQCNNKPTSKISGVEARTGLSTSLGNDSLALKGMVVYHDEGKNHSSVREIFGFHSELVQAANEPTFNRLSELEEYRIVNRATGKLLTVLSESANSAGLGLELDQGDENQVWTIQRINDREMRLIPKTYADGVLVRNPDFAPSVARLGSSDASTVNYRQHLLISANNDEPDSPYSIRSVVDRAYLTGDSDEGLNWRWHRSPGKKLDLSEQWEFIPLSGEYPSRELPLEHFLVLTEPRESSGLLGACQIFDLGAEYFIKQVKLACVQSKWNKSSRFVSFNSGDDFLKTVYPNLQEVFEFGRNFPQMSGKSSSVQICDAFFIEWAGGANNRVDRLEVLAIPAAGH